jgi:hypothetical protein
MPQRTVGKAAILLTKRLLLLIERANLIAYLMTRQVSYIERLLPAVAFLSDTFPCRITEYQIR